MAGTIDSQTGLFTAGQNPGTFEVKATSVADNSNFSTASITIDKLSIVVTAPTAPLGTIAPGETLQFQARVTGLTDQSVIWSTNFGTITPTGLLTANDGGPTGVIRVTATSVASPTHNGTARVTIPKVSIRPGINSGGVFPLPPGGVQQFTAIVARLSNPAVTWSGVDLGETGSTITDNGFVTAGRRELDQAVSSWRPTAWKTRRSSMSF